jgi:23S rRNA (guanosine2251-2'-O)-methyltransferase
MRRTPIIIILPDIRSAMNVGAIFRSADGVGAEKIYLTGYTATPNHPKVTKTSLGSEDSVPWEYVHDVKTLITDLKKKNYTIIGLELDPQSECLWETTYSFPIVLLVGNEIKGIPKQIRDICDKLVYIPMLGKKESLNLATSTGITIYELLRQFNKR